MSLDKSKKKQKNNHEKQQHKTYKRNCVTLI